MIPSNQLVIFEVNKPPFENIYKKSLDPFVQMLAKALGVSPLSLTNLKEADDALNP